MKTKRKTPEIRFRGFTDDWEQRKLSHMMDFSNGINAPKENYGFGTKMISVMDILSPGPIAYEKIINSVSVEKKVEENNKVENGDLIFVRSSEIVEEVGWSKAYLDQKYALYSGFSIRGKKKDNFNSYFVELSLNYFNRKDIERKAGGSTRFNVNQEILKNIKILIPEEQEENYIAGMFTQLEHMIALHQRKLQQLKEVKRGMLLKMFPIGNKKTPSLRFYGFKEKWVNKRIRDLILKGGSGGTPRSTNPEFYNGDIPFLSIKDITSSNGYIVDTEKKITKEGLENSSAWIVPSGSICLAMYASVGKLAIANIDLATSQAFYNMVFESDIIRSFSYQRLILANESGEWERLVSTGTQANLNAEKVRNFEFKISKEEEELKEIGLFFKKLDRMIELQEREIELLEETKKGFLQKMFV